MFQLWWRNSSSHVVLMMVLPWFKPSLLGQLKFHREIVLLAVPGTVNDATLDKTEMRRRQHCVRLAGAAGDENL